MKILGIDSSADTVAVALLEDRTVLASFCGNLKKTHSSTLLPIIHNLFAYAGITPSDIGLYSVSVGPGSFTGIRIGVATVKGLAFSSGIPVCGVSTLEAMAYSFTDKEGALVCPVLNARRGEVYYALFRIAGGKPERILPDSSVHGTVLEKVLEEYADVLFCGDGVPVLLGEFTHRKIDPQNQLLAYPTGCGVALSGYDAFLSGKYINEAELSPIYLKPSQAERERNEKLKINNIK